MHDITAWMTVNRGTTFQNGTSVNHHASRTVSLNAGGMFALKTNYTHILTSCTFQNGTYVAHHASRTVSLNAGGMLAIEANYIHIITSCGVAAIVPHHLG